MAGGRASIPRPGAHTDEFNAPRAPIDVGEFPVYSAVWRPERVHFQVDGRRVKTVEQAPDYPMQMMVAVFDFPAKTAPPRRRTHVPELVVDYVRGSSAASVTQPGP